jgi:hypothetical protein
VSQWNADRELVWREARRQLADLERHVRDDPYVGWCARCQENRSRSQCRQVERDETCVYACQTCGHTVSDELPF